MEELLAALQESLLTHGRPVQVAFNLYEIFCKTGYTDEDIQDVAEALEDIVS